MPVNQTVEFFSPPGQTITAKLFQAGSDTQIASVSATEATNRKGVYLSVFTDIPTGLYRLLALVGTTPVATWWIDLVLQNGTYQSYEMPISVQVAGVYNASPTAGWVNGSFGDRLLIGTTNQRTVAVTGSHHVASDIHQLQPAVINNTHFAAGAIDANALATDAVTEINSALLNTVVENGLTVLQCIRLANAVLHGAATNMDSTPIFKSLDGTKDRVSGTITGFDRSIASRDGS